MRNRYLSSLSRSACLPAIGDISSYQLELGDISLFIKDRPVVPPLLSGSHRQA